ncbi:MAG: hypothetical protein KIPDCIKN_01706 [Haliscomenobacter sp.]|jgi:hypothetical protein|nr:hypothetical protein [Haliscomenobacter sp.]
MRLTPLYPPYSGVKAVSNSRQMRKLKGSYKRAVPCSRLLVDVDFVQRQIAVVDVWDAFFRSPCYA